MYLYAYGIEVVQPWNILIRQRPKVVCHHLNILLLHLPTQPTGARHSGSDGSITYIIVLFFA